MSDLERARPKVPSPIMGDAEENANVSVRDTQGASIVQIGISERSLLYLMWLPLAIALVASIAAVVISVLAFGGASLASNQAQLAERNAKLAQYQLELTLREHNLEVPKDNK